jgi:hypothetical protein
MGFLGVFEEFFSETVYPYRYPVGIVVVIAIVAGAYLAWRLRWHQVLWDHRYLSAAVGAPVLLVMSFGGYYTLSPLWERSTLCEDNPLTSADESLFEGTDCDEPVIVASDVGDTDATPTGDPEPTAAVSRPTDTPIVATTEGLAGDDGDFEPRVVSEGTWRGADDFHFAEGKALLIETEPGKYIVRVEEFSVRNGPDLFVYLSPNADGYDDQALNLGDLKATDGAFNYEIPEGTDVSEFRSVVVWCKQFAVLFGHATLN